LISDRNQFKPISIKNYLFMKKWRE